MSQSQACMRHPLTRTTLWAANRMAEASMAPRRAAVDAFMDSAKPFYEGVELLLERLDLPPRTVHAQAEGLPPRWRALPQRLARAVR